MTLFAVVGCQPPKKQPILPKRSLEEVLTQYNQNINDVSSFQARIAQWEIHFTDQDKVTTHKDSGGKFFFQTTSDEMPEQFYLQADTTLSSRALVLACDPDEFWMISKSASLGYWAKRSEKKVSCVQSQLIHPDLLLELIGLKTLPENVRAFPMPLYRLYAETFSITYVQRNSSGLFIEREIVFDRHTDLPSVISVYHSNGQPLVVAELSNYQTIGSAQIPGNISLTYPEDGSYLKLKLRKIKPVNRDLGPLLRSSRKMKNIKTIQQLDFNCENTSDNTSPENP